ncbi:MAG: hypothetical protein K1Y02_23910 [Candidatus Hydrogenedentes bacterium]|nr:hypothetical protein [Candidatus Hydrogenedentota bacterium]
MPRATGPLLIAIVLAGCGQNQAPSAPQTATDSVQNAPLDEAFLIEWDTPPPLISAYGLFTDPAHQKPSEGVIGYDINSPLFSDYATKHRFIKLPKGKQAAYREDGPLDFPVGTVIAKTFGYLADLRDPSKGERIVETRILVRQIDGWVGLPYIWNDDATEAKLAVAGARIPVKWTHTDGNERSLNYAVPNMNQCKQCHENSGVMGPIGPRASQLNKQFAYADGEENQLAHWSKLGRLTGAPADISQAPRLAKWDDPSSGTLDERARAYLEINCAHCHNPKGPAYTSGLDLMSTQREPVRFGVMKTPVAAGRGSAGDKYAVVPGNPDESFLVHRMESTDPGKMMPAVGRLMIHDEGIALVREWIKEMQTTHAASRKDPPSIVDTHVSKTM